MWLCTSWLSLLFFLLVAAEAAAKPLLPHSLALLLLLFYAIWLFLFFFFSFSSLSFSLYLYFQFVVSVSHTGARTRHEDRWELGTQIENCSVTLRLQSEFGFSIKLFCHSSVGGGGNDGGVGDGGDGNESGWGVRSRSIGSLGLSHHTTENHLIGNLLQFAYFIAIKS